MKMQLIIKRTAKYAKYAKREGVIIKYKLTENWYNPEFTLIEQENNGFKI